MIAASKGHTDIIMKLLRCGANREAVNVEFSVCIPRLLTSVVLLYTLTFEPRSHAAVVSPNIFSLACTIMLRSVHVGVSVHVRSVHLLVDNHLMH